MGSHGRGEGSTANGKTRTDYCRRVGGGSCGKVKRPNLRSASVQPPQGDQSDLRSQDVIGPSCAS
jgi:hypothetical protein